MGKELKIEAVIETAIYVDDLQATQDFYTTVLGLPVIRYEPGRHVFFQVGDSSVLLAFLAETTLRGDGFPPHGTTGPGHFALGIDAAALDAWRDRLRRQGVAIEQEAEWPAGGKSLYFRDPSGNVAELVTPGVWNLPSGW
jgi:catechol 2,3-dioxygenase-like lactoylglutathione lyase family enzyme